jgi:serine phosphatase RsbU (regulator of sigma subunit)
MNPSERGQARSIRLRNYLSVLVILWTTAFAFTLSWSLIDKWNKTRDVLRAEAQSAFRKDRGLLRWYAARGGVFVPASAAAQIDRTKPVGNFRSGQRLVPVDASDMIREVHGFGHEESELQTHLVGLAPRHSANAPDAWETDALKRLADGEPEVSSERTIHGTTFLQSMRPLKVEESCLKCHAENGYRAGELRGGVSIAVPFAPLWPLEKAEMLRSIGGYGIMWLFGLCSILFGARQLRRQIEKRIETEEALRKREGEMIAAQQLQERLFPEKAPSLAGFDIAGASFPAGFAGGDYYDYIPLPEMCYALIVGDVSGHGLGSALLMASARSILRSIARTTDDVSEILTLTNRFLREDTQPDHFVTLFLGRLDPRSRRLSYSSAGHPTAYVVDATGDLKARLDSTGPPLGIMPDAAFPTVESLTLESGDLAILFTDGVLEATAPDGTPFGESRLLEIVRGSQSKPASEIIRHLHRAVRDFCRQEALLDDMTAIVLKVDARPWSAAGTLAHATCFSSPIEPS